MRSIWMPYAAALGFSTAFAAVVASESTLTLDLGNDVKLEAVYIPSGTFVMGSPLSEPGRRPGENQHTVTIGAGFYMGKYHVTVGQYRQFAQASGYKTQAETEGKESTWTHPPFSQGADEPVVLVTWNDAQKFAEWLSAKTGRKVSLPTDAEWEYACRAGATTAYNTGQTISSSQANYGKPFTEILRGKLEQRQATTRVGSFGANGFGLFDMHGNALQWCQDKYMDHVENLPSKDPLNVSEGTGHVVRGGAFDSPADKLRCACREYDAPTARDANWGFRVRIEAR